MTQAARTEQAVQHEETPPHCWAGGWPETPAQFEALVEAFQDRLVAHAYRKLSRFEEAEDVVQDVFVKVYRALARPRDVSHVSAYLYRMTANACADVLRKRRHDTQPLDAPESQDLADKRPRGPALAAAREELERVETALRDLPEEQAETVRLRLFDELRFAEIAAVMDVPIGTVKSRFRYGLLRLRTELGREQENTP